MAGVRVLSSMDWVRHSTRVLDSNLSPSLSPVTTVFVSTVSTAVDTRDHRPVLFPHAVTVSGRIAVSHEESVEMTSCCRVHWLRAAHSTNESNCDVACGPTVL